MDGRGFSTHGNNGEQNLPRRYGRERQIHEDYRNAENRELKASDTVSKAAIADATGNEKGQHLSLRDIGKGSRPVGQIISAEF